MILDDKIANTQAYFDKLIMENQPKSCDPYLIKRVVVRAVREWNPEYDQNATCECGHPYHRHFDSYEDMNPAECKYCQCSEFTPEKV